VITKTLFRGVPILTTVQDDFRLSAIISDGSRRTNSARVREIPDSSPIAAPHKHGKDLVGIRLIQVYKGRGATAIRRGVFAGDVAANCGVFSDVPSRFSRRKS
jgi:hypothetical protein